MNRRVLFITPPYSHTPGPFERFARFAEPPLGLAYLASAVRNADLDCSVEILDGPALGASREKTIELACQKSPDCICISTTTLTAETTRRLCQQVKKMLPNCLLTVGGNHPSALPEDLLPDADVAVIGEGERTLVELLGQGEPTGVPGVAYQGKDGVVINEPRPLISDLDSIAPPAYDLLPMDRYCYPYPFNKAGGRYATAITSRGCPGRCSFCAKSKMWGNLVRLHSIDRVMKDISMLVERHGVSLLYLYDDTFLSERQRVMKLSERIRRAAWPLKWICQGRADEVDEELCQELAAAGCVQIEIGVESGDEKIRDSACKGVDEGQIHQAFETAHKAGLQTKANFLFGFPDETPFTIQKSISMALETNATYVNFFHLIPLPGSSYFHTYRKNGWLTTLDWNRFSYHDRSIVSVPGASSELLNRARRRALMRFYLRPGKLAQLASILIRSRDFRTVVRGFFTFLNGMFHR